MALHNYEVINFNLLGARQLYLMAIIGHNLDSGSIVTIYGDTLPASFASNSFSYTFIWAEVMYKFPGSCA